LNARPLIIAHRGASGYLPEHTLEAKALAYGQGADYLEQDVVATRDAVPVVLHDHYLDDVSDVADRFPGRARADGRHYVVDFDWAELRELTLNERRNPEHGGARFPNRFPLMPFGFRIARLDDEIRFVQGLNRSTGRNVGIYPEIKAPEWHRAHGIDLADVILRVLNGLGYHLPTDRVYVQCFDGAELERVRRELGSRLPLIRLIDSADDRPAAMTAADWTRIAGYADGVGVDYRELVDVQSGRSTHRAKPLLASLRATPLDVHAYTFRADVHDAANGPFAELLGFLMADVPIDGLFCDQPDLAVKTRDRLSGPTGGPAPGSATTRG
jgi:glycerophosphoryl diester phosphodiesterase